VSSDAPHPRFVYVLLQYKGLDHTRACVASLAPQLNRAAAEVVVVDNFSSEDLVRATRGAFEGVAGVHLLFRPENDGYARGNNAGYRHAREVLHGDFIAVFNNDVEILQADFPERVQRCYRETRFSIVGPDIRVRDGRRVIHQNPSIRTLNEAEVEARLKKLKAAAASGIEKPNKVPGSYWKTWFRQRDLVLHGAALVFSPRFLADFDEPFDPRTFLYEEERILYLRARAKGHDTWYDPSLVVWHRTKAREYKLSPDYRAWRRDIKIQSYEVLLTVLKELQSASQ
jgi:GT2 family glycosyltransferase